METTAHRAAVLDRQMTRAAILEVQVADEATAVFNGHRAAPIGVPERHFQRIAVRVLKRDRAVADDVRGVVVVMVAVGLSERQRVPAEVERAPTGIRRKPPRAGEVEVVRQRQRVIRRRLRLEAHRLGRLRRTLPALPVRVRRQVSRGGPRPPDDRRISRQARQGAQHDETNRFNHFSAHVLLSFCFPYVSASCC